MSPVSGAPAEAAASDVDSRLTFFKNLQTVTNKVHATANIDEIMLELSGEICSLFNADRLTIYSVGEDKASIVFEGQDGPELIQGSASSDRRPEYRRLCCPRQEDRQYP
jgi:hypothetical protein